MREGRVQTVEEEEASLNLHPAVLREELTLVWMPKMAVPSGAMFVASLKVYED